MSGPGSDVSLNLSYRMGLCLKKPKRNKGREGEREILGEKKNQTRTSLYKQQKGAGGRIGQKENSQMVNIQVQNML